MAKGTTPEQAANRWSSGLSGQGASNYAEGTAAFQGNPGQLAAAQKAVWLQNVTQSQDLWASRVGSMDPQMWKQRCAGKGKNNLVAAATDSKPKVLAFQQAWLPAVRGAAANLPPRGSYEANMQRARAMADFEHAQRGRFRGRK